MLSVIVPIYNVEKYLRICIESLVNQSYKDIEILLVDDGSTDQSKSICDEYEKCDCRIKVFHKANGGLSDARNYGLLRAEGDYVVFIDSDDYCRLDMFELLMAQMLSTNSDISVCSYLEVQEEECEQSPSTIESTYYELSGKDAAKGLYLSESKNIQFLAWNKIYKKSLFTDYSILYPKGKLHEDMFTTYKLLYRAEKVVITKAPLYFYRQRNNSIMGVGFSTRNFDMFEATEAAITFYKEEDETELMSLAVDNHIRTMSKIIIQLWRNRESRALAKEIQNLIKIAVKDSRFKPLSFRTSIRGFLFGTFPGITSTITDMKEKS